MIETELGNLRRSHYSDQINASMDGVEVTVMGWILTVRGHGNISFATIKDKNGSLSIIAKKGDCSDEIREKISTLKAHSSIGVTGKVKSSQFFTAVPFGLTAQEMNGWLHYGGGLEL